MKKLSRKKTKLKKISNIDKILEIPVEIVSNEAKISMVGFSELLIENYKGIIEYEEFFIKVNTISGVININGFNLKLNQMTEDEILVTGKIESMDFESIN